MPSITTRIERKYSLNLTKHELKRLEASLIRFRNTTPHGDADGIIGEIIATIQTALTTEEK